MCSATLCFKDYRANVTGKRAAEKKIEGVGYPKHGYYRYVKRLPTNISSESSYNTKGVYHTRMSNNYGYNYPTRGTICCIFGPALQVLNALEYHHLR